MSCESALSKEAEIRTEQLQLFITKAKKSCNPSLSFCGDKLSLEYDPNLCKTKEEKKMNLDVL